MRIKCYSVRLQALFGISEKACKAIDFNGNEAIIPKSQIFEQDFEVAKSEAWWISEWILKRKDIQFSTNKVKWFKIQKNGSVNQA